MTTHLVIGEGEVGIALSQLLNCDRRDVEDPGGLQEHYDMIHICYPWQIGNFTDVTAAYEEQYTPTHVVVHSTVPVGTCDGMTYDGHSWVHSPVRGKHPDLLLGLQTFTKHYGGQQAISVAEALKEFFPVGYIAHEEARITEAGKLWELACYGMEIVMEKYIYTYCQRMDLPYTEVYNDFVATYNEGWEELGELQFIKPHLDHKDGPIGGHCVVQGAEMLNLQYRNLVSEVVIAVQKELSGDQPQ